MRVRFFYPVFNNVVEFKIPDWNQDAIKNMKKTPLYKNAAKPSNLLKSTNKIMLDQSISTNGWDYRFYLSCICT